MIYCKVFLKPLQVIAIFGKRLHRASLFLLEYTAKERLVYRCFRPSFGHSLTRRWSFLGQHKQLHLATAIYDYIIYRQVAKLTVWTKRVSSLGEGLYRIFSRLLWKSVQFDALEIYPKIKQKQISKKNWLHWSGK